MEKPMPSHNYDQNLSIFEKLFSGGINPYVQPTGMTGFKIVAGVPETGLNPYYVSPFPQRAKNSGDVTIFLAESPATASCECFGNTSYDGAPTDTWLLQYRYSGLMLNIATVPDDGFKNQFLQWSGAAKHQFSQDFKYYAKQKGYVSQCDSIGWQSVSGEQVGHPGLIIAWHSGDSGVFKCESMEKIK